MPHPDDLTEGERIELQRLIGEVQRDPHAGTVETEEPPHNLDVPDEEFNEFAHGAGFGHGEPPPVTTFMVPDCLNANTGFGTWNGHEFTLTPEQLKKVRAIFAECIAANLSAEIERLRNEVS